MPHRPLPSVRPRRASTVASACLALAAFAPASHALVSVDALATPLADRTRYDLTIVNDTAEDLVLVSLVDAPLADPLIGATLRTPSEFLGSYDGGLGFVDFLEFSGNFGAGGTYSGFGFESLSSPGAYFRSFEAIDVLGQPYSGSIRIRPGNVPVPEGGSSVAVLGLLGSLALRCATRTFARQTTPN